MASAATTTGRCSATWSSTTSRPPTAEVAGLAVARARAHVPVDLAVERALALAAFALRLRLVLRFEPRHLVRVLERRDEPQARRVYQKPAGRERHELAAHRRVAAAVVALADRRGRLAIGAEQEFSSVDLPTPDVPSSTAVRRGAS